MSTLKVTNIQATGETASRAVSGVAAAWVNYDNEGTVALNGSQNISSCTDTATGRFRSNFTSSMSDSVYCSAGMHDGYTITSDSNDDKTTTGEAHLAFYASGTGGQRTAWDAARNTVSYHGDLA